MRQSCAPIRKQPARSRRCFHSSRVYPLVQDLAVDGVPVTLTCRVLGFSKQAFYKWQANPVTDRDWNDAHLINAALDIHADDPAFGYRFIADQLAERGVTASENRVWARRRAPCSSP